MKLRVGQLAQSGATSGQVLTWDATAGLWKPATPSCGGGSLTVQDENGVVATGVTQIDFQGAGVTATAGTSDVVVTIPGGSGGGGGSSANGPDGKPTIHTPPATANAKDDEFNDGTGMSGPVNGLDAKWSKHNLATSSWLALSDSRAPGALLFDIPTGQAAAQSIYQAVPSGDFTATARIEAQYMSDRQMWGVFILDASGNGLITCLDTGDVTYLRTAAAWGQSTPAVAVTNVQTVFAQALPIVATIRKSGTTYYGSVALGDRLLAAGRYEASTTSSMTPAYVGVGRVFGGGVSKVAVDYFRVL